MTPAFSEIETTFFSVQALGSYHVVLPLWTACVRFNTEMGITLYHYCHGCQPIQQTIFILYCPGKLIYSLR